MDKEKIQDALGEASAIKGSVLSEEEIVDIVEALIAEARREGVKDAVAKSMETETLLTEARQEAIKQTVAKVREVVWDCRKGIHDEGWEMIKETLDMLDGGEKETPADKIKDAIDEMQRREKDLISREKKDKSELPEALKELNPNYPWIKYPQMLIGEINELKRYLKTKEEK